MNKRKKSFVLNLRLNRVTAIVGVTAVTGVIALPSVVSAQTPPNSVLPIAAKPNDARPRIDFIEKRFIPLAVTNPTGAVTLARQFLADNPSLNQWQRILTYSQCAAKLYEKNVNSPAEQRAQSATEALAMLEEGMKEVIPDQNRPGYEGEILTLKSAAVPILLGQRQYSQAEAVLQENWPIVMHYRGSFGDPFNGDGTVWIKHWTDFYKAKGTPSEIIPLLKQAFQKRLEVMHYIERRLGSALAEALLANNKEDEALQWAKLTFMLCDTDEGAIKNSTQILTKIWMAIDLSPAKPRLFATAQAEVAAPNPLESVALPVLDTALISTNLSTPAYKLSASDRISQLLALGSYREAMLLARKTLVERPDSSAAIRDVARVFKAKDGDIARANLFLTYYQNPEGENPVVAFLKETESLNPSPQ